MPVSKRLNVLHVISDTNIGGAGRHLLTFLDSFDRSALHVRVLCPAGSLLASRCAAKGIEVIEMAQMPPDESLRLRGLFSQVREMVKIMKNYRVRVVHTHASFAGRLAAKIAGAGCIVYTKHRLDQPELPAGLKGGLLRLANDLTCHRVIAVSRAVKENLLRQGVKANKIEVIYNGIDIAGLRKRALGKAVILPEDLVHPGPKTCVVGVIARLEPEKGHRCFLDAARLILPEVPDVKFLIVGTGSLEKELKVYAEKLGIKDKVIFTGLRDDIPELISRLDVVVLPSLSESFGLSLVEGMCLGKPCVASNVGGIKEIIVDGKNGLLAEPGNARALAEKIVFLLQNPALARRLGEEAARTVEEKFDARLMAKKITELYFRCLR